MERIIGIRMIQGSLVLRWLFSIEKKNPSNSLQSFHPFVRTVVCSEINVLKDRENNSLKLLPFCLHICLQLKQLHFDYSNLKL